LLKLLQSSIGKKQIVAATGIVLYGFLIGHLGGNLLFYLGPDAFNEYSQHLHHLQPWLNIVRTILILSFIVHMYVTLLIVKENRKARGSQKYAIDKPQTHRSFAVRTMPISGPILLGYIIFHLMDFTYNSFQISSFVLSISDRSLGLYGIVYNSFLSPLRTVWYLLAMVSVGLHISHGFQSMAQTFGFNHPTYTPIIQKTGLILGIAISVGFSSIPIYVLIHHRLMGA